MTVLRCSCEKLCGLHLASIPAHDKSTSRDLQCFDATVQKSSMPPPADSISLNSRVSKPSSCRAATPPHTSTLARHLYTHTSILHVHLTHLPYRSPQCRYPRRPPSPHTACVPSAPAFRATPCPERAGSAGWKMCYGGARRDRRDGYGVRWGWSWPGCLGEEGNYVLREHTIFKSRMCTEEIHDGMRVCMCKVLLIVIVALFTKRMC